MPPNAPRPVKQRPQAPDVMGAAASVEEFAPAKVNLSLKVLGRRNDGYHELESLVVFARAGDRLTARAAADLSLDVLGPFGARLAEEDDNLVLRAGRILASELGREASAHLMLEKNLPVASGIGGGSGRCGGSLARTEAVLGCGYKRRPPCRTCAFAGCGCTCLSRCAAGLHARARRADCAAPSLAAFRAAPRQSWRSSLDGFGFQSARCPGPR